MKQDRTKATLLILLQCAVYGASFIALKVLVDKGVPIFAIICIRFSIGFLTLVALKPLYNKNSSESSPSHKSLKYGLIAGIALFFAYMWQTLASQTTTPAKNGLFTDLFIIFTPIATMILTRQFSIKPVFSGLMAFIGIIVLSGLFVRHESLVIGDLFASFCALAFTLHFILLEQFAKTDLKLNSVDPITFTLSQFFAVALISLILSITVELKLYSTITFTPEVIFALAFLAIPTTAFTYLFQFNIQESLSANKVSFLYSFECAFSYLFSLMLGYDKFSLNFLFGTVILLSAMIISSATSRVKVSSS